MPTGRFDTLFAGDAIGWEAHFFPKTKVPSPESLPIDTRLVMPIGPKHHLPENQHIGKDLAPVLTPRLSDHVRLTPTGPGRF